MVASQRVGGGTAVRARSAIRTAARRAAGVPDASEVGTALADLRATLDDLHLAMAALREERDSLAAEVARQRDEVLRIEQAVLEQASVLEAVQSQHSAGVDR